MAFEIRCRGSCRSSRGRSGHHLVCRSGGEPPGPWRERACGDPRRVHPRRTVRRILPLAAAIAVSVSAAAPPSGAQTTAENDCYLYAFGFVNPFLVAELTIMGRPGESVQVGQRALLHDVSDRWTFEDGVVKDAAGAIIAPYRGSVSAVNGSRIEVKITVARESASGGSPDRVSRGPGTGIGRGLRDRGLQRSGRPRGSRPRRRYLGTAHGS